ncbi:hypothetical protein EJB05_23381, partial [Eragrostis curvula]
MSQRVRSTSVAGSSSNTVTKVLPLIQCPRCGSSVVRLVSKQPASYGWIFYTCEHHSQDDPASCGFWKWQNEYELYLRRRNLLPLEQRGVVVPGNADIEAGVEVNQDQFGARIWRSMDELKLQLTELIQKIDLSRKNVLSDSQ